jgi:hypothetical protein
MTGKIEHSSKLPFRKYSMNDSLTNLTGLDKIDVGTINFIQNTATRSSFYKIYKQSNC